MVRLVVLVVEAVQLEALLGLEAAERGTKTQQMCRKKHLNSIARNFVKVYYEMQFHKQTYLGGWSDPWSRVLKKKEIFFVENITF